MSALSYTEHYDKTWEHLMQSQGRFALEEYGDRNVLTTWTMSYEQVQKQSNEAAWLLKLWGFLDHGELWYKLVAAASKLSKKVDVPTWLLSIAKDNLAYTDAVGLLSSYSLADAREGSNSHSMHSVLHRWCGQLVEDKEQHVLGCIAAGIVAINVPSESEPEFSKKRKRLLGHAIGVSAWLINTGFAEEEETDVGMIQESTYYNLGYFFAGEDRQKAVKMYQRALQGYEKAWGLEHTSTLDTVNNLGLLYADLGRLDEAEKMYQRALQGKEKAWGLEHTSTLSTVNNLGILYADLGRLDEAEKMYQRALQGFEKAWGLEHTSTLSTVNNLGNLYAKLGRLDEAEKMYQRALQGYEKAIKPENLSTYLPALRNVWSFASLYDLQHQVEDARTWYSKALSGFENVLGTDHLDCQELRSRLAGLGIESEQDDRSRAESSAQRPSATDLSANIEAEAVKPASRRHKLFRKFRRKLG